MGDDEMRLMRLNLLRDLHFIDASKSEQSDIVRIQARIKLQNERLNELRFTPLATTVYLSHLPNPTPSHHLSCMRLPTCHFFYKRLGEEITKSILRVLK